MHSDRELLELATKEAGLQLCGYSWIGENEDDEECEILESAFVKNPPEQDVAIMWNPLTDDGDALRLALQLRIRFARHLQPFVAAFAPDVVGRFEEPEGDDIYAAARRAIVRAAAAIGESMQ